MDVFEAILSRRSIRRFQPKPVEQEQLELVLEAARWAPSDENRQRCQFVVVETPSLVQLVKRLSPGISSVPACIIVICSHRGSRQSRFGGYLAAINCGMAAQNMLLCAHNMGLGACVVRSFSSAGIRELVGIPENVELELLIALGYPKEAPQPPARKPVSEIAFRDKYGQIW